MIHLHRKSLQHWRPKALTSFYFGSFSTSVAKSTLKRSNSNDPQSLTLSYLVNSCALSLESATAASKNLQLDAIDSPDLVLKALKSYGLTHTHIRNLITVRPKLLLADPDKTLKPNFELLRILGVSGPLLIGVIKKVPRFPEIDAHTVIKLFRAYGFSDEQISTLTIKQPRLYLLNAHKIIKPKLDFFKSLGLAEGEIAQMLSSEPYILGRSLENQISPTVEVIKRIAGTDESVLKIIKRCYGILENNTKGTLEPNRVCLIHHGVPESNISKLLMTDAKSFIVPNYRFKEVVEEIEKLGFDPTSLLFILAVRVMTKVSRSLWERKVGLYCGFGMSKDEVISAFKLQPMFMATSEDKIKRVMDFFVNVLKFKPALISRSPNLMLFSLEKRIIPRSTVLHLLMTKNLIKENINLVYAFKMSENLFVKKFVSTFHHLMPEVVEAHLGKLQIQGFSLCSKT